MKAVSLESNNLVYLFRWNHEPKSILVPVVQVDRKLKHGKLSCPGADRRRVFWQSVQRTKEILRPGESSSAKVKF